MLSNNATRLAISEALDVETQSSMLARWQRKALAASASNSVAGKTPPRCDSGRCPTGTTPGKALSGDRFIPLRAAVSFDGAHFALTSDGAEAPRSAADNAATAAVAAHGASFDSAVSADGTSFRRALASCLLSSSADFSTESGAADSSSASTDAQQQYRVLAFKNKAPPAPEGYSVLYSQPQRSVARARTTRHIPTAPERILDAPELLDDYYLNLLDWSQPLNTLAVALGPSVYTWGASTGTTTQLLRTAADGDHPTAVAWVREGGGVLAVGTASSDVQLWDYEISKKVRSMGGHAARVGALAWSAHILASGSRDCGVFLHDVRIREHHVATLAGHTQEVCGLAWAQDGGTLASGGNDNTLCLWDPRALTEPGAKRTIAPRAVLSQHQAAVKALAWCPWQRGLLATAGGTADRSIKTWNTASGTLLSSTDTGSQVCALLWSPHDREILSAHGFSENELVLWSYPTMTRKKELTGHTARILAMAAGPDGSTVCSAGADETLRFWRVFGEPGGKRAISGAAEASGTASGAVHGVAIR